MDPLWNDLALRQGWAARLRVVVVASTLAALAGCGEGRTPSPGSRPAPVPPPSRPLRAAGVELPEVDPRLCTAVAILIDTSTSMRKPVRDLEGRPRPKRDIARESLERIIEHTRKWKESHPDVQLEVGIFRFSSSVSRLLPMGPFDADEALASIRDLPSVSGTAIGRGLREGFAALYASGCVRKHVLCITDGRNSSGPPPGRVAGELFEATGGEVEIHFVAFDTSSEKFDFLERVNGSVVEAADGGQLAARLSEIYEKRILAEAMPAEKE